MSARAKLAAAQKMVRLETSARSAAYFVLLLKGRVPGQRARRLDEIQLDAMNVLASELESIGLIEEIQRAINAEPRWVPDESAKTIKPKTTKRKTKR